MSWVSKGLKKVGKVAQKVGKVVGTVAQKAAPFAGLIPGVGPLAGLALGAGGSVLAGHNLATTLKSGAMGAASGLAGSKLLGGKGIGGLLSRAQGALGSGGAAPAAEGAAAGAGGGGGIPSSIGGLIAAAQKRGISIGDLVKLGVGGAGAVAGIQSANKAGRAGDAAFGRQAAIADQMNARGAPLADAASKGLLARLAQGSNPYADRANPFTANFAPPPPVAAGAPPPAPMLPPPAPMAQLPAPPLRRRLMAPVAAVA